MYWGIAYRSYEVFPSPVVPKRLTAFHNESLEALVLYLGRTPESPGSIKKLLIQPHRLGFNWSEAWTGQ